MMWINGGPCLCTKIFGLSLIPVIRTWLLVFNWAVDGVRLALTVDFQRVVNYGYSGPCSIDMSNSSANGTVRNPYGWNSEANIFFLDQPFVPLSLRVVL